MESDAVPNPHEDSKPVDLKTIKKPVNAKESLLNLRMRRTNEGVLVYAKSRLLEEFFKELARANTVDFSPSYFKIIKPKLSSGPNDFIYYKSYRLTSEIADVNAYIVGEPRQLYQDGSLNMRYFTLVGLKDGVEVLFPGMYSRQRIKEAHQATLDAVKSIYMNYMRPFEISLEMNITEN